MNAQGRIGLLATSCALAFAILVTAAASAALAAFPGANGKIAFDAGGDIHTVNSDGTGQVALTSGPTFDGWPAWSADGRKIAFRRDGGIYTMTAAGSGIAFVTIGAHPSWSPSGAQLVFDRDGEIYRINADGTGEAPLTNNGFVDAGPAWSPDGALIAFTSNPTEQDELFVMSTDGSNQTQLTTEDWDYGGLGDKAGLDWSPDGSRIAYDFTDTEDPCECFNSDVWVVRRDGASPGVVTAPSFGGLNRGPAWSPDGRLVVFRRAPYPVGSEPETLHIRPLPFSPLVVDLEVLGRDPSWQPLYEIPREATPLSVSLVPNFRQTISASQCAARGGASSSHGPPLALGSCNPPDFAAGTVAHFGSSSVSGAQLTAVPGDYDPANGDQADLAISASLTDVRTGAGADYDPSPSNPDATIVVRLRLSDTLNGPGSADPATVADLNFAVPFHCSATASTAIGSDCAIATGADAVSPGAIREAKNTVVQTFRVRVNDAGSNGTRGDPDDRTFATQGIYVP